MKVLKYSNPDMTNNICNRNSLIQLVQELIKNDLLLSLSGLMT